MRAFFQLLAVFSLLYAALLGAMFLSQRKLLYIPSKTRPSLKGWGGLYREIQTQTKDQLTLTHWHARQGRPHIVVFHGNAGNIEGRAYKFKFLADQGYSLLLVSYRGYGGNPGRPTEQSLISDSSMALQWLFKQEGISPKDVVLLGESLGSGVATALAAQYPVGGVIFDGAYSSIADVGQSAYPFVPVKWLLKDTWDSQTRIQKVRSPMLFIHSRKDLVIPFRLAQKLFQAAGEPKTSLWLERSGHDDNLEPEFVKKSLLDFLQSVF